MTNKHTKKALLSSALALILCFAMLVGTTFAWFTDNVTSGVNTIESGNLDIEVYYAYPSDVVDGDIPEGRWKKLDANTPVFNKNAKWEPGYTEAVFFKFDNAGSLALQFQINVDILNEVLGKTKSGSEIQLSKYIQAYGCHTFQYNYKDFLFTDRQSAIAPAGAPTPYYTSLYEAATMGANRADNYTENALSLDSWQWLDPTESTYATLVLWMPTTVGNEANHNGTDLPSIDLGLNVVATQYNWEEEKDSFDQNYDKDAAFPNLVSNTADLDFMLSAGNDVTLGKDMHFNASETTADSGYNGATGVSVKGGTLDGNGKSLGINNWGTWDAAVHTTGGTIKNLTIDSGMRGIFMGSATSDVYIDHVTIDGTIYTFNSDGGSKDYGVYISNSTLNGWTSHSDVHKEVVYTNCEFGEGKGYAFCRPYGPTQFIGCSFAAGFTVDSRGPVTFENCTIGGVALTADNLSTLVTDNIANATVK